MQAKFPSIRQFREVIKEFRKLELAGKIQLIGHPKLHGANASVLFPEPGVVLAQGKEQVWTEELKDTYGFYEWVLEHKETLLAWGEALLDAEPRLRYPFEITGEWAGGNVAPRSSVEGMEKFWGVFGLANIEINEFGNGKLEFIKPPIDIHSPRIRMIYIPSIAGCRLELDLDEPELIQAELARITSEVEENCPIANYILGLDDNVEGRPAGRGEGVVWHPVDNLDRHLWFKVKGKKHSVSKIRELAALTPEQVASMGEFVDYAVTDNRMEQAVRETGPIAKQNLGKFLKWLQADIEKEETDTLVANGLDFKDLKQRIADKAIGWYRARQPEEA